MAHSDIPLRYRPCFRRVIQALLLFLFLATNLLQFDIGLADNGDWTRIASWITSGPVGFHPDVDLVHGSPEWKLRYFYHWVPNWKFDLPVDSKMFSSVLFIWLPGVVLNRLFFSSTVLSLVVLSIFPRILLLVFLLMVFRWISSRVKNPNPLYITIGLPLVLLFTTTDIVVFFSSFYQETASFVFLFFALASVILVLHHRSEKKYYVLYFVAFLLLATAKVSNAYWPCLGFLFIFPYRSCWSTRFKFSLLAVPLVILPVLISGRWSGAPNMIRINAYHSLFRGVAYFSQEPENRLAEIGLSDTARCIGKDAFTEGADCYEEFRFRFFYDDTLRVIIHEPLILVREFQYAADRMHKLSVDYLGRFRADDKQPDIPAWLNGWSWIKLYYFPRGWPFVLILAAIAGLSILSLRQKTIAFDLGVIGLITMMACVADLFVALLGEGIQDLNKHLFFANILFDVGLIAGVNIAGIYVVSLGKKLVSGGRLIKSTDSV